MKDMDANDLPLPGPIKSRRGSMSAFYDLGASEVILEAQTRKERLSMAIKLGYDCVALAHQAGPSLSDRDKCSIQPLDHELLYTAFNNGVRQTLKRALGKPAHHGIADTFTQLTRINLAAEDTAAAQAALLNAKILHTYDIIAVQPRTEQIFNIACTTFEVDIISLDLSHRLPFKFKPGPIKAALDRDVYFEICYSPSLRQSGARRQFIANCQSLLRETRGRGVILSSCCRSSFEMRGPNDVINVGTFWGMTEQQARAAVSANAAAVVQHAVKRRAIRGMVSIEMKGTLSGVENNKKRAAAENNDLEGGAPPNKFGGLGKQ